jgi:hypothetical protein
MIDRLIDRPSPMPWVFVVTNGSNKRSMRLVSIPMPQSVTTISAVPEPLDAAAMVSFLSAGSFPHASHHKR